MILVGGENLCDLVQGGDEAGDNLHFTAIAGGSPYNCAVALGYQGIKTGYLTPISTDILGDKLYQTLMAAGVAVLAKRHPEPTSLALVTLKKGMPSYQFYRDNTAERQVRLEGLIAAVPDNACALQLGSLTLTGGEDADIWADFFVSSKQSGLVTCLDPNIRPELITDHQAYRERLGRLMAHTDILKLSDEDLAWLYPEKPVEEAFEALCAGCSAALVVLTLGAKGAWLCHGYETIRLPAASVLKLADTIGAGDTFMASLLAGLKEANLLSPLALKAMPKQALQRVLIRAQMAAAMNCEHTGCQPPKRAALMQRLNSLAE